MAKQVLIGELGLQGFASTQMCFNAKAIEQWFERNGHEGWRCRSISACPAPSSEPSC